MFKTILWDYIFINNSKSDLFGSHSLLCMTKNKVIKYSYDKNLHAYMLCWDGFVAPIGQQTVITSNLG